MKKQLPSEQIARIIQRENVITFKRKNEQKSSLKSQKEEQDEIESLKSNNNNEDSVVNKITKRNLPLPELNRQRKRLMAKNITGEAKPALNSNYLQKEVRQHDNIILKNANNHLTNENIRLKTKNMNLEKELTRLQKVLEEDPQKMKLNPNKDIKLRGNDHTSIKMILRNIQKDLEDARKENTKIKTSIKFTTISELQIERDSIMEESVRLREMLEQERSKVNFMRAYHNQQGVSLLEQKLYQLQERNGFLVKENNELKLKMSKNSERDRPTLKAVDNQKNLTNLLFNARRVLKQKERELDILKNQLKKSSVKIESLKVLQTHNTEHSRAREVKSDMINKPEKNQNQERLAINKQKRLMSKSAQKYRSNAANHDKSELCQKCNKLKDQNTFLSKQVQSLKAELEQLKIHKLPIGELSKSPIKVPSKDEIDVVKRFLTHRFKAHHLTLEQAIFHLISIDGKLQNLQTEMSVGQILQILMSEPFSLLSDRYIQAFIACIFYRQMLTQQESFTISQSKKVKRKVVQKNFKELIVSYELINQNREEEMFIQIAELITQYQQHILKALNDKRNSENTINEKDFYIFFQEIQLEKEYIDFMVSQIILESLDLDHLNIYNLFEIFFMPAPEHQEPARQGKKKYNMIESVVKQEDEEYEQSKSFMQSRQKTVSKHDEENELKQIQEYDEQFQNNNSLIKAENEQYDQNFQEEKMDRPPEEHANGKNEKQQSPKHYSIVNAEDEYVEDYQS